MIVASLLMQLGVWWVISLFSPAEFLPSPWTVLRIVMSIAVSGEFFLHLGRTLGRITMGFSLAMGMSIVLGTVMARRDVVKNLVEPAVMVGLTVPALAWSMLSIMWWGLHDSAAVFAIAVLITPAITLNIFNGMSSLDESLAEMASAFRLSRRQRVRDVVLPQLTPYLASAVRYGLSLAWKVVVIVEMLGLPSGVGYKIAYWFQMFSMKHVIAWTLAFTVVVLGAEYGIFARMERRVLGWRQGVGV